MRPLPTRVRIIATNDFHGTLEPRVDARGIRRGGAGAVAGVIEQARRECASCAVLLLDGGDMFQGTPASNLVFGRSVVAIYDALGYTAAALGNHEFDWGQDTLQARMRDARYAILGANVRYADGRDVPWIRDDTLVEVAWRARRHHRRRDRPDAAHDARDERSGSALRRPRAHRDRNGRDRSESAARISSS